MRYSYVYFMSGTPETIREVAPRHAKYWRGLRLPHYLGGPFADRSGGLITFEADSDTEAERLVANDPFSGERLVGERWLKKWDIE